jgi:alkanesulfonate monooxygenase SsuD/methylene tetrahydromethanopterin reductase-like flavin-dependent oxidoreductase (luciferase family)
VGWMKPEFDALGVDVHKRGAIASETLRVLRHCFDRAEPAPYDGKLVKFPAFVFAPRPLCPPIWVGGNGPKAIARAVEFGDAWHPMTPAAELKAGVAQLRAKAAEAGRGPLDVIVRRGLKLDNPDAARARLKAEEDAGATYFILDLGRYRDETEFGKAAEVFMTRVAN